MGDDVGIRSLIESRLMANWTFSDFNDMLFTFVIQVINFQEFTFFARGVKVVNSLRLSQFTIGIITIVGILSEALEESIDCRFLESRSQGIQHSRQFNLADTAAFISIVLLKHRPPELLTKCWVCFPLLAVLEFQRDGKRMWKDITGLKSTRV
ncbi:hypothetical protein M7I_3751 [Glarea lozoyensis 74030]|uniref:Uncharacterized protein n=1 Tax=Glarea lozoyensis (strain ATCC 74030 / MF5533) TaxID=1104152 RepID=H0EMC0_GLAL7|nr:hypothetical protein M7I_3751 [Glarea lozoyensis 74030]